MSCVAEAFHERLCNHKHEHQPCAGRETVLTEGYNFQITDSIHKSYKRQVETLNQNLTISKSKSKHSPKLPTFPAAPAIMSASASSTGGPKPEVKVEVKSESSGGKAPILPEIFEGLAPAALQLIDAGCHAKLMTGGATPAQIEEALLHEGRQFLGRIRSKRWPS